MPKKIRFETDEETSEETVEEVEVSGVGFPQPAILKDQIKRIRELLEESGNPPKPIFERIRVITDMRKEVRSTTRSNTKKDISKDKKPTRKF